MKTQNAVLALAAISTVAVFAADMQGSFNSWLGYLSGMNAYGDRTTLQGAASGSGSDDMRRTVLIGAGAGTYSTNLADCVGVGYDALARTENMSNVVAIGSGALYRMRNVRQATWVNGQFYASADGNCFWMKTSPNTPDTNAPIYYADGVLHLNATVSLNGEAISGGGGGGGAGPVLLGYDFYVDPVNGSDTFAGTTPGSAKHTMGAAYSLVTTNGQKICLLPGTHAPPPFEKDGSQIMLKPYRVRYIAPYGPEKTVIDGNGASFAGSSSAFLSVEGCTIRDFSTNGRYCPAFEGIAFSNCVFAGEVHRANFGHTPILSCVFEDCRFEAMLTTDSTSLGSMYPRFGAAFYSCEAYGSVFTPSYTNTPYLFSFSSRFENCFISLADVDQFDMSGVNTVLGNAPGYVDTTAICTLSPSFANFPFRGCLLGLNDPTNAPTFSNLTNTILTNAETVASMMEADYRPAVTNWRYRYNGYNSAKDRAVRDTMLESIRAALEAASTE